MKTFGTIVMSRVAFNLTIDDLDEKSLTSLAVKIGERAPREFILFKSKDFNAYNVTSFMKIPLNIADMGNITSKLTLINIFLVYFMIWVLEEVFF